MESEQINMSSRYERMLSSMRSWKTQVINLANVRGALFNPMGSLANSKCPADDENAVMCLELGCRGIWKYPLAKSIELKILVLLLIFLSTFSIMN